jgi:glycosyltransferase involved in cell wall biosynthesis
MNSDRIRVIRYGVDAESWRGRRSYKIRKEFDIDRNNFVIVSVSRFAEEKGYVFLLETIKHFKKLFMSEKVKGINGFKFLLAGEGELLDECRKLSDMMGLSQDIIYTGFRTDIKSIFMGSDLYISHSKYESPGLSTLEALASGLPLAAACAGGKSDMIDDDVRCGLAVEYNDIESFASSIMSLIRDRELYNACRSNSCSRIKESYSIEKMVEETFTCYTRSLSAGYSERHAGAGMRG